MIRWKVCLLGSFAVGKTSLVRRFVEGRYSDQYHTTIGVKISRKSVELDGDRSADLMVWDVHGDEDFQRVPASYLRGANGCLLVADGTRENTLARALELRAMAESASGPIPVELVINKADLRGAGWIERATLRELEREGIVAFETSAKTGDGVEDAFRRLAQAIAERSGV